MRFIKRFPGIGYLDRWLWLPKTHVSPDQIASAFSFVGKDKIIRAWETHPQHFCVPRNYLSAQVLGRLPYPVYDTRYTDFPRINLKSSIILDAVETDKDYQTQGSRALLAHHDCILCLRCGAGKTLVGLHSAVQLKTPFLITVSDEGLAEQWMEKINQFIGLSESDVGFIGGKRNRRGKLDWERPVVIGLVQTLARRNAEGLLPPEMTKHYGLVLSDEVHLMGAPYFNTSIPPFHGRRWGLSATPTREDGFDPLLRYTYGDVVYTYLRPNLRPTFFFRQLPTSLNKDNPDVRAKTYDKSGEFHYGMTYGYLARERNDRTALIAKDIQDALDNGRQVLVLTHSRDMTEVLNEYFPKAGIVHGDVKGAERFRRIRECNPVIAIMSLGKQALDKPNLDALFVVEPFAKSGVLQQTMGRILRAFAGKKHPIVVIFEDVFIRPMAKLCGKIRVLLNRWPDVKGGRIPHHTLKLGKKKV